MSSPAGGVRVEITGDVHEFATSTEAKIKAAMTSVAQDITSTLNAQTASFERAGLASGKDFGNGVKSGLGTNSPSTAIREAADAAKGTAGRAFEGAGNTAGEDFGKGARRGVSSSGGGIASEANRQATKAGQEAERTFKRYGEKAGEKFTEGTKEGLSSLKGAVVGTIGLAGVGEFAKKAFEEADKLEGANIKIEHVFGESAVSMQTWAKGLAGSYGLSAAAAETAAGAYGSILSPLKLSGEESSKMSEKLVQLAADTAQALNADPASVQAAFSSGLRGRSKALRQYGIDISASSVQQEAQRLGLVKLGGKMTDAAKTEASYNLILQETKKYQGATADSGNTLATQKRRLSAEVSNLTAQLGTALFPALTKIASFMVKDVVPAFTTAGHWIKQNADWLKPLVLALGTGLVVYKSTVLIIGAYRKIMEAAAVVQALFTTATEETNAAMALNPIGLVVAALAVLVVGVIYAYNHFKVFRDIVHAVWDAIQTGVEAVVRFFTKDIPKAFSATVTFLHRMWNDVITFVKKWGPTFLLVVAPFIGIPLIIYQHFGKIVGWLKGIWTSAYNDVKTVVGNIVSFFTGLPGKLNSFKTAIGRFFTNIGASMWNGIKSGLSNIADLGKNLYNAVASTINNGLINPIKNWHFTIGAFGVHHTFEPFGGIPDIPLMAHGGKLGPGWSIVGDAGMEAIFNDPKTGRADVYSSASSQHMLGNTAQPGAGGFSAEDRAAIMALANRPVVLRTTTQTIAKASNDGNLELARR